MTVTVQKRGAYLEKKDYYKKRRADRYYEWVSRMERLDLREVLAGRPWGPFIKVPQLRKAEAARAFTIWLASKYGTDGGGIRPSTRTMASEYGINQDSAIDYLAIAVDLEWIDVCQEARQGDDPRERRPAVYQIRCWWSDEPRTLMQEGWMPTAEDLLRQIEERETGSSMDRFWLQLLDEPFLEGDPAQIPF